MPVELSSHFCYSGCSAIPWEWNSWGVSGSHRMGVAEFTHLVGGKTYPVFSLDRKKDAS